MKFLPNLIFEKVIPAIQETSTSCHIIYTIIFHFTDGEGLSVDFGSFLLYQQEDELNLLEQSYLNEDLEDTCPSAGFDNIKKFVNETRHRIIAVKAGMPYEEHVKLAEVRIFYAPKGTLGGI